MKNTIKIILVALIFSLSTTQASAIPASLLVSQWIEQTKSAIQEIIGSLDVSLKENGFATRQTLLNMLQQIDLLSGDIVNSTFDNLDGSQVKLFENIEDSISNMESSTGNLLIEANKISDSWVNLIRQSPLASNIPVIESIEPSYLISGKKNTITIKGFGLQNHPPVLTMKDHKCAFQGGSDTFGKFICNTPEVKNLEYRTGEVELAYTEKSLVFLSRKKTRDYHIPITIIPKIAGNVTVLTTHVVSKKTTIARKQHFEHTNRHCVPSTPHAWQVNATGIGTKEPWEIDIHSIKVKVGQRKRGRYDGIHNKTGSGFIIKANVNNDGTCVYDPVFGTRLALDARGKVAVDVNYNEYRHIPENKIHITVKELPLNWSQSKIIDLPDKFTTSKVSFASFLGERTEILLNKNSIDQNNWIKGNTVGNSLKLEIKTAKEALK